MTDGAREYLESVAEYLQDAKPSELNTIINELYRVCSELTRRMEIIESYLESDVDEDDDSEISGWFKLDDSN